jgi:hypothetical protein
VNDVDPSFAPRLPLSKTPGEVSFKLKHVIDEETGTIRVRDWVLRAMERYRFVIGTSNPPYEMESIFGVADDDFCRGHASDVWDARQSTVH